MANIQFYLILFIALNSFLFSNAQYIGTPKNVADLQITIKSPVELTCVYNGGDGKSQFLGWFKDNESISNDKEQHYAVKTSKKESKLTIKFEQADETVNKWYVKTKKFGQEEPIECQFSRILAKRSPQRMITNRDNEKLDLEHNSVRRLEDESITLKCIIEPNRTNRAPPKGIRWQFSKNDEKFTKLLPPGVRNTSVDEISIERVKKIHRGYYRCKFNNGSFTALLRVKDPLAALGPFIGIVTAVIILVVIILIFEKRRKTARKAAAAAEDEVNDNANDPLVRSGTKLTDNENKKLAVQA